MRVERRPVDSDTDTINDYEYFVVALTAAFWPHFLLGSRALPGSGFVKDNVMRHMLLFHDNRFATDANFLFFCANTASRLSVNRAVSARVRAASL